MEADSLQRFIVAQEESYHRALCEVKASRKCSHWMWYIFPQLKGLGRSSTSSFYGIAGLKEAQDFLSHPILGNRLREISEALLKLDSNNAHDIFGSPDNLKLRSCMTLFDVIEPNSVFQEVLDKFFSGRKDNRTLSILNHNNQNNNQ